MNPQVIVGKVEGRRDRDGPDRTYWPAPWLGGLLLVSLLFMLNLTLIFTGTTGMDLYGFYTLDMVSTIPLPLVLSTLLNLAMATGGYLCYRWLWQHQSWFTGGRWGPFTRGLVLSGLPVLLAYAPAILLTSHGGKPTAVAVAGLMAGSLCVTHALRDREARLDPTVARYWFAGGIAAILVFLALSISGMLVLYFVEQLPASGNLLWTYEYEWPDLGYPREEFHQRQRDAVVGFTLAGSGFLILVLGGSMLGSILRWTRPGAAAKPSAYGSRSEAPEWAVGVLDRLWELPTPPRKDANYSASFGGYEVLLSREQYLVLAGNGETLLSDADLLIDKVMGTVQRRTPTGWARVNFRAGRNFENRRSGPFLLLCIYGSNPGKKYTNVELRSLLHEDLSDRPSLNVTDFFNQLQKKRPSLPVAKDGDSTYIAESFRVCILSNRGA